MIAPFLLLLCLVLGLSSIAAVLLVKIPAIRGHFTTYVKAYCAGGIFFAFQFAIAFHAQFKTLTPALRTSMSRLDWFDFAVQVGIMAFPVILAFLDQSISDAGPAPAAAETREVKGFSGPAAANDLPAAAPASRWRLFGRGRLFLPFALAGAAFLLSGCQAVQSMTAQQRAAALVRASGEAYGTKLLMGFKNAAGQIDPASLAQYETEVPKFANVMQGQLTPADFGKIAQAIKAAASPQQMTALGFLDSVTTSFVQYNGGANRTVDGSVVDAEAHQLAAGMVDAVGFVTGTNWTPPAF